jgi:hypothetical protein
MVHEIAVFSLDFQLQPEVGILLWRALSIRHFVLSFSQRRQEFEPCMQ